MNQCPTAQGGLSSAFIESQVIGFCECPESRSLHSNKKLRFSDWVFDSMRESLEEEREELPSAVDDAASVILESKRKEAFCKEKCASREELSVRGLAVFVTAILLLVALSAIFIYSL